MDITRTSQTWAALSQSSHIQHPTTAALFKLINNRGKTEKSGIFFSWNTKCVACVRKMLSPTDDWKQVSSCLIDLPWKHLSFINLGVHCRVTMPLSPTRSEMWKVSKRSVRRASFGLIPMCRL